MGPSDEAVPPETLTGTWKWRTYLKNRARHREVLAKMKIPPAERKTAGDMSRLKLLPRSSSFQGLGLTVSLAHPATVSQFNKIWICSFRGSVTAWDGLGGKEFPNLELQGLRLSYKLRPSKLCHLITLELCCNRPTKDALGRTKQLEKKMLWVNYNFIKSDLMLPRWKDDPAKG